MENKIVIGVDVGKNGGIVLLKNGKFEGKWTIPKIGILVDVRELSAIFKALFVLDKSNNVLVAMEDIHAIFGSAAGATFEFGRVFGMLEGIIASIGFKYILVQPKVWQKEIFKGIPEIRKPTKTFIKKDGTYGERKGALLTKKMAEVAFKRLFPGVDLRATDRSKIQHDGLVDAILIAEFANRSIIN